MSDHKKPQKTDKVNDKSMPKETSKPSAPINPKKDGTSKPGVSINPK